MMKRAKRILQSPKIWAEFIEPLGGIKMKKVTTLAAMLLAVAPFTVSAQTDQSTETKTPAKKKTSAQTKSSEKSMHTAKGNQPLKLVTTTPLPGFPVTSITLPSISTASVFSLPPKTTKPWKFLI
jgi:hypothetical protein